MRRTATPTLITALLLSTILFPNLASPTNAEPPQKPDTPSRPPIYNPNADAKTDIAAALSKAKRDNQRVLIMFGANWCGWCHKLHDLFKNDRKIARILLYEYQLVLVDTARRSKNMDLVARYGIDLKRSGVPILTVLDADGKVLINQETGPLESGSKHEPKKVTQFLARWRATPLDAERVFAEARAAASKQGKRLFVHLGAPWCTWCHKLEDFLVRKDMAAILDQDYINVKIDVDRMRNGKALARRIRAGEGSIPWFAILDAGGEKLATSEGPDGNIGFPMKPKEFAHFQKMLRETRNRITNQQLARLDTELRKYADSQRPPEPPKTP